MFDNNIHENNRHLPHVGRARGLIAVWQQTRLEAWSQISTKKGRYLVPIPVTPGCGRAVTLALLCEAATRNAARAPNPIPHQRRGRGRGLQTLLHSHSLYPTLELVTAGTVGMGRARSRNSGPCPYPDYAMHVPNMWPRCLCPHRDIPNPHLDLTSHLQKLPLDPHHWSPIPLQNHLSWAMQLTQIKSTLLHSLTS